MKNDFCRLAEEDIEKLPEKYLGLLLSPFQYNEFDGYVRVPSDTFKRMIEIIEEAACAIPTEGVTG